MKDNCRESLSVMMDNEGDELELRRVLKSLTDRPDDSQAWRRYHLARSVMQRDYSVDVSTDISERVLADLENEPAPQVSSSDISTDKASPQGGSLSFAGSAAVAATVSLMVIAGAQFYNGDSSPGVTPDVVNGNGNSGVVNANTGFGPSVQPASLPRDRSLPSIDVMNLPSFRPSMAYGNGLTEVGFDADAPMFMAPYAPTSLRTEKEQSQLLQHYLERHAEGAAQRSGEAWIPLLRASSQENPSIR
ncbi:sigma-E factor negative regulatory protein [Halomonas sp. M20]|uniref:sigma-E factor negative regulatory protein n=1 Tax=Halomonas sp. M20 TaxID=2763264 RepID=UPI001D09D678|nr:RseA family anti-sigma factor [Halomonas sp. M20]